MTGGCAADVGGAEFARLVRDYRPRILRHITSLVRDASEAEDLTQETFLRARRGLPGVHDRGAVGSWLYRVATNISIDWLRAEHRRATAASEPAALETIRALAGDTDPGPVKRLAQSEMSTCVDAYIDGLREDYRTVIVLHDIQGLPNPDIAALLGLSVGNVKIKVHRARAELRAALERGCSFETDERGVTICEPVSGTPASA